MLFVTGVVLWVIFGLLYRMLEINEYTPQSIVVQVVHWIITLAVLAGVGLVGLSLLLLAARWMP